MDILGAKVNDRRRGVVGTVIEMSPPELPHKIRVAFSDGREAAFHYPADFEEKLRFVDDGLQREAELVLAGQRTDGGIPLPRGKQVITGGASFVSYGPGGQMIRRDSLGGENQQAEAERSIDLENITGKLLELTVADDADKEQRIIIVKNAAQQNSKQGIYWAERDIAKTIRNTVYNDRKEYDYRGAHYEITALKAFEGMEEAAEHWEKLNRTDERPVKVFRKKGVYDNAAWGYELTRIQLFFPQRRRSRTVEVYSQLKGDTIFLPQALFAELYEKNGMPVNDLRFADPDTAQKRLWNLQRDVEVKKHDLQLLESQLRIIGELHVIQRRKLKEQIDVLKAELPGLEAELEQAGGADAPCFGRGEDNYG